MADLNTLVEGGWYHRASPAYEIPRVFTRGYLLLFCIQHFYNQALAEVEDEPFFSRGKLKKKLKQIFEGYRTRVLSCDDFDDLDDLLDNSEVDLEIDY